MFLRGGVQTLEFLLNVTVTGVNSAVAEEDFQQKVNAHFLL